MSRRHWLPFLALFGIGVAGGLVQLLSDGDETSGTARVAVANTVHVVLAAVVLAALAVARHRDRAAVRRFLARPFTEGGASDVGAGIVLLPLAVHALARRRPVRGALVGVPLGALSLVAFLVMLFVPLRAGQQVFAAFDPDFTRDAWGGPTYLGASLAHWLDLALLFYAGAGVLRLARRSPVVVTRFSAPPT